MSLHHPPTLKTALHQRGFRLTAQRQKILHMFQTIPQGNHLSAEDLHLTLKEDGETISLSTVYRTLHMMTQMGVLRELELAEGHKHYELNPSPTDLHHHLVCMQCNRTLEFKDDLIFQISQKQAKLHGYQMLDCQLTLYVACPEATQQGVLTVSKDWVCEREQSQGQFQGQSHRHRRS